MHAVKRGLKLVDFNEMSIGMILDYINTYDGLGAEVEHDIRSASQKEFNNF